MDHHFLNSSYREKLIEHLFIGELLKLSWANKEFSLEVSKPEVDNSGYDLVVEARGIIRHIQLKTAFIGSSTSRQNINISLARKPSGCIVWIYFREEDLKLGPFLYFGGAPGNPLPVLGEMKTARHNKGNATGFKSERPNIKVIPKTGFTTYLTVESLFEALFGAPAAKIQAIA
jgi:hypothetical protein